MTKNYVQLQKARAKCMFLSSVQLSALIKFHSWTIIIVCVPIDTISFCSDWEFALSKLKISSLLEQTHVRVGTNAHTHTCLVSFNSLSVHYRLNGSESRKGGFKGTSPAKRGLLILGQEALCSPLHWSWRVDSHNSRLFDRTVIGYVVSPPQCSDPSPLHNKRHTLACASFHVGGTHRPDVILHSKTQSLVFHS